jgi:histone H3/H4
MPKTKSSSKRVKTLAQRKFALTAEQIPKFRPGEIALQEIERYQKRTKPIIPTKEFVPAVVQVFEDGFQGQYGITAKAVIAMQCALEDYITQVMRLAEDFAQSQDHVTVTPEDFRSAVEIDAKNHEEKLRQFKEERKSVEVEYWKSLPEEERGSPSSKWEL